QRLVVAGWSRRRGSTRGEKRVRMRRDLRGGQGDFFRTTHLRECKPVALVQRKPAAKIWECERQLTVAAISRADKVEKGLILRNRQELPFAKLPARGREVPGKHADLTNVRLCHCCLLLV